MNSETRTAHGVAPASRQGSSRAHSSYQWRRRLCRSERTADPGTDADADAGADAGADPGGDMVAQPRRGDVRSPGVASRGRPRAAATVTPWPPSHVLGDRSRPGSTGP